MIESESARVKMLNIEINRLRDRLSALDQERVEVEGTLSRLQRERDDIFREETSAQAFPNAPVILTERTEHLAWLAEQLRPQVQHVIVLKGGMGVKQRRAVMAQLMVIALMAGTRVPGVECRYPRRRSRSMMRSTWTASDTGSRRVPTVPNRHCRMSTTSSAPIARLPRTWMPPSVAAAGTTIGPYPSNRHPTPPLRNRQRSA